MIPVIFIESLHIEVFDFAQKKLSQAVANKQHEVLNSADSFSAKSKSIDRL